MRIFVDNVDSYVGKALCADLRSVLGQDNRLFGTVLADPAEEKRKWTDENFYCKDEFRDRWAAGDAEGDFEEVWEKAEPDAVEKKIDAELVGKLGIKRVVSRTDKDKYFKDLLSCSLIVFDLHSASLQEVEAVIKHLKLAKLEHEVTFVLISSVNVWANTKKEQVKVVNEDEEEEEPEEGAPPKPVQYRPEELKDSDKDRRTPSRKFEPWKYLETLTLSLAPKDNLRPHVVCAGVLYGNGEETFNELFKAAWLTQPMHPITMNLRCGELLQGTNYIPCVHVRDVARLVRVIAADSKQESYLIAVDKSRLTQAEIMQGIANQMSDGRQVAVKAPTTEELTEFQNIMTLDLILQPSSAMRSKEFDWWSKKGLVVSIEKVASEFCRWRNLRPVKTVVLGPPGSGSERFSNQIAEQYLHEDPPHLTFEKILDKEMKAGTEAAARLQRKVAKLKKGQKLKLKIRTKLVRKALMSNVCRYRGYVLEGYPATYEEAEALFTERVYEEGEEPPEEEEEGEEEEEEADEPPPPAEEEDEEEESEKPKTKLSDTISPEFVVCLNSSEALCKKRIFSGFSTYAGDEEDFVVKTKAYNAANLVEDGSACTADFFAETGGVKVLQIDVDKQTEQQVFQVVRVYMESKGQFFNYLRSEESQVREQQDKLTANVKSSDELAQNQEEALRLQEDALREQRGTSEAGRRAVIAEGEAALLQAEALPLQQYLLANVVPTLTEGLGEVCKVMPDDPIEYLAQYLFAHAQDIAPQLEAAAAARRQ
eukprot:TRINITY_DN121897_c0_g1_i1.p1 TRINITY_DN121897_c0_g1~~TRINITY_DN121897_c0_g1_i1.p1  ORF type:complete len:765 (+),score=248.24 TRINITY_DN121897_c0_g1_i1:141-2435(+)